MKDKKKKIGFTLIELLAVIIVLAIIALIATPIIFNVIENAKLKSLENSCYGVIDAVRTKYAEGLLNSEDGTVKLSGDVKDITVSGEQPIEGTWEIDNSSDSDNRGIKIKDVKFGSMKDYICTNVNDDGTINSKVMCVKEETIVEDLSCFEYKDIMDYDMDIDACVAYLSGGDENNKEDAMRLCNATHPSELIYVDEMIISSLLDDSGAENDFISSGVIKPKTDFSINVDGCITFLTSGEEVSDEELTNIKGICNGEIPVEENIYIKESLSNSLISGDITFEELKELNLVDNLPTKRVITGYTCESKDVVIPRSANVIYNIAFKGKGITSVDFSKARNLTTIFSSSFNDNEITSLTIPNSVTIIGRFAFDNNKISSLKMSTGIKQIRGQAFGNNQLTNLDLSNATKLTMINEDAFQNNQLTNLKLPNSLITIGRSAFDNNKLTNVIIPNNVTDIGNWSFRENQLTSITIPNSVTTIGDSSFYNNPNLTLIEIDKTENSIEGSPWGADNATITWLR